MSAGSGSWREGLRRLEERVALLPTVLLKALDQLPSAARAIGDEVEDGVGVTATGVGSSAAHARFLVSVLGELGIAARFAPLTRFLAPPPPSSAGEVLIVFSQGLSPNARVALAGAASWRSAWLVTATPEENAPSSGPDVPHSSARERRRALSELRAQGVRVLSCPGGEEYGTLLRVTGPMIGYAAALALARSLWRGSRLGGGAGTPRGASEPEWAALSAPDICARVDRAGAELPRELYELDPSRRDEKIALLASGSHVERIENLRLKLLEGTLLPSPPLLDLLDFAHGPLQQLYPQRALLLALTRRDAVGEEDLLARLESVLDPSLHRLMRLRAELPGPLAVLEHEALLNSFVLRFIATHRVDQVEWPGKGRDAPLYTFGEDLLSFCPREAESAAKLAEGSQRSVCPALRVLEDLSWPDLAALLERGCRSAVLPLGSTEQHGPHLPFATDTWIARELARRLCARVADAVELPVVALGCASEHLSFPGTLSLAEPTLVALLCDVARSLERHGFARLFVFSAHGGNRRALTAAEPVLSAAAPGLAIACAPGLPEPAEVFHRESARHGVSPEASGHHAGEFETSIIARLAPSTVRRERFKPGLLAAAGRRDLSDVFYPDLRRQAADGTVGDPRGADAARAERYLEAWVDWLLDHYRREGAWKYANGT